MRLIAGPALVIVLALTGCSAATSSPPAAFDPSQGTPTDKVRWGIQFASANGSSSITASAQEPDVQARTVESMGQAVCRGLDATAATIGNGVKNLQATIDGLAVSGKLGRHEAIVFTAISVTAYCPKYKADFDALMTANQIALKPTSWTPADNQYGGPTSTTAPTPKR
jgi:outer membrane lipoprotein SlyB